MCEVELFSKMRVFSVMFLAVFSSVRGQGTLPNGDPYFCVPPGICPDTGGIDPRIITPDDIMGDSEDGNLQQLIDEVFFNKILTDGTPTPGPCPTGTVQCFAQGTMSNCGLRLVPPATINANDGNASIGAYPWQAYLEGPTGYLGSGSLLSPYHVLTASHKVLAFQATPRYPNPPYTPANLNVIMGVNNPETRNAMPLTPRSTAAQIFIYMDATFDNSTLKNDIAIIRLKDPIRLVGQPSINTICLPPATATGATYASPQSCVVSGWGQRQPDNNAVPTQLKQVRVNTTDMKTCEEGFAGRVNTAVYLDKTGELCAGGQAQKDACFQDGGAPLTCGAGTAASRFTVAGIVIWGKSCGIPGVYGVYTNVPVYRQWIIQTITAKIS